MNQRIYLDNNASTALDPRVGELIQTILPSLCGNPSSLHYFGQNARTLICQARSVIASFLRVKPQELIFTSGATEGVNMTIRGLLSSKPPGHIITSSGEHPCVFATVKSMESYGHKTTFLSSGPWGAISSEAVKAAIQPNTKLVALMAANNETGVKTDIEAIAKITEAYGIPFFVDGTSLLGKELFNIPNGVTAMAFSGHKFHAPQGIGFCFHRAGMKFQPTMIGGEQEYGRRGGTENLLGIVSLGKAIELLSIELPNASMRMKTLRDKFEATLMKALPEVFINGQGPRSPNVSNLAFKNVDGETLLIGLDTKGIAASHGSACSSGSLEPSRVLISMGLPIELARSSLRFSLSRFTTESEIERACEIIIELVQKSRNLKHQGSKLKAY